MGADGAAGRPPRTRAPAGPAETVQGRLFVEEIARWQKHAANANAKGEAWAVTFVRRFNSTLDESADGPTAEDNQDLFAFGSKWSTSSDGLTYIPVCWSGVSDHATEKEYVRSAVIGAWQAPRVPAFTALLGLVGIGRPRALDRERKGLLGLESSQRLSARARSPQVRDLLHQVEVDVAHANDEGQYRGDELDELERPSSPSEAGSRSPSRR
jgi:hypothetical protein